MTSRRVTPCCTALFLLLAVAGGGWCQTQLLDPEPRTCRTQDNDANASVLFQGRRNEYPVGGVLMVLAKVPAGLFGSLEVYLCQQGDAKTECLDRVPLQLADGSGTSYSLQKVPRTDNYEIPVILPDDITCPTCTLQLRVLTSDCADEEACPQTEDTFCSDITVRDIRTPEVRGFELKFACSLNCPTTILDMTDGLLSSCNEGTQPILNELLCTLFDTVGQWLTPENMEELCTKLSQIKQKFKGKLMSVKNKFKKKVDSGKNKMKGIVKSAKNKMKKGK